MAEGGIGGSNESFISFAFAVVSVILIVLYIPWGISKVRGIVVYYRSPKKVRATMSNPMVEMWESLCFLPRVFRHISEDPAMLVAGAKVCWHDKVFFLRCVMPKFLRFVIRPRILLPGLWFVLFSSAVYSSLTFDPYAILGLPPKASTVDIKKAYRALSKRYHPDLNKTDEARDIYLQVRRAYKALVDRDAFEEEEAKSSGTFAVGVALPRFLTSREHDGLVLFGLLSILILGPLVLWYKFTNNKKLPRLVWHIRFDKERVENFMKLFGIPEDPKYTERQVSRQAVLNTLVSLKMLPPNVREDAVHAFPPFPDFIQRCIQMDKNTSLFKNLGFDERAMETIHAATVANGVAMVEEYERMLAARLGGRNAEGQETDEEAHLLSPSAYKATRYLFQQHTIQVDRSLLELQELMGNNLLSPRKLLNLHEEMYDLLDMLYARPDKVNKQIVNKLVGIPQRVSDLVDSIEPEIQMVYRRSIKNYQQMMEARRQQEMKAMRSAQSGAAAALQ